MVTPIASSSAAYPAQPIRPVKPSQPINPEAGPRKPSGSVSFIGAGPGAADLITVRGTRLLAQADVVLYDALTDPALRAYAPSARWISVGKRGYRSSTGQQQINQLLVSHAQAGHHVVRLKGGDPSVFGRLEEELQALHQAGLSCQVVPGVTAALAAAAQTQRPLTRRGQARSVTLTTATTQAPDADGSGGGNSRNSGDSTGPTIKPSADTEVFYMAGQRLSELRQRLLARGWSPQTAVAVVSNAGLNNALHSDHSLESLPCAALLHGKRPLVVLVGVGAGPLARLRPASLANLDTLRALSQ